MVQTGSISSFQGKSIINQSSLLLCTVRVSSAIRLTLVPLTVFHTQGDEELAREALSRRQQQVEVATSLAEQMNVQTGMYVCMCVKALSFALPRTPEVCRYGSPNDPL